MDGDKVEKKTTHRYTLNQKELRLLEREACKAEKHTSSNGSKIR